jgi:hypothetical protein
MLSAVIMGLVGLVVVIGIAILISHFSARA